MPKVRNDNFMIMLILSIPIVIQSGFFSILLIQYSESTMFRLFIAFAGIGLSIVPVVLSRILPEINEGKSNLPSFNLSQKQNFLLDILSLLLITITPWIPVFQSRAYEMHLLSEAIVPGSALMLSSSILGFCAAAVYVFIRDFKADGVAMGIFRLVVIGMCTAAVMNILLPALSLLVYKISIIAGNPRISYYEWAMHGEFRSVISRNIQNVFSWHLYFFVGALLQFRFYKRWLIQNKNS